MGISTSLSTLLFLSNSLALMHENELFSALPLSTKSAWNQTILFILELIDCFIDWIFVFPGDRYHSSMSITRTFFFFWKAHPGFFHSISLKAKLMLSNRRGKVRLSCTPSHYPPPNPSCLHSHNCNTRGFRFVFLIDSKIYVAKAARKFGLIAIVQPEHASSGSIYNSYATH